MDKTQTILDWFDGGGRRDRRRIKLALTLLFLILFGLFKVFHWVFAKKVNSGGFMSNQSVLARFTVVWLGFAAVGSILMALDLFIIISIFTLTLGMFAVFLAAHVALYQLTFFPLAYLWDTRRGLGWIVSVTLFTALAIAPGYISQELARQQASVLAQGDFTSTATNQPRKVEFRYKDSHAYCDNTCGGLLKTGQVDFVTYVTRDRSSEAKKDKHQTFRGGSGEECKKQEHHSTNLDWCAVEVPAVLESDLIVTFLPGQWFRTKNHIDALLGKPKSAETLTVNINGKTVHRQTRVSSTTLTLPTSIFINDMTVNEHDLPELFGFLGYNVSSEKFGPKKKSSRRG
jgi:ABC-type multidrug transport system fused ATPase/permease subunit